MIRENPLENKPSGIMWVFRNNDAALDEIKKRAAAREFFQLATPFSGTFFVQSIEWCDTLYGRVAEVTLAQVIETADVKAAS